MKVYLFKDRFSPLVESGVKRTTIRPKRKNPTKVGDELSLRQWLGKPFRGKQRILLVAKCLEVGTVDIVCVNGPACYFNGKVMVGGLWDKLARDDGFTGWEEMYCWFNQEHGLPFAGDWIRW